MQYCVTCHGDKGSGPIAIDLADYGTDQSLFSYIETYMPRALQTGAPGPDACVGQCAADITDYMSHWRVVAASCSSVDPVIYSERALKLLTANEYANSVQDLFPEQQVPVEFLANLNDETYGWLPNHVDAVVASARARQFMSNAEKIANWAVVENDFLGACTNATSCADNFINGFAYHAFRRPLKTGPSAEENEVALFRELFADAPTPKLGLRWAVVTALTSPNFLYRSELGIPVAEALENGWDTGGDVVGDLNDYEAAAAGVTVNGTDFSNKSGGVGETSPDSNTTFKMYTNGTLTQSFNFSGLSILTINVRGNDYNNVWPMMEVSVNDILMSVETVDSADYTSYRYLVGGVTGNADVVIAFNNDQSQSGATGAPGTDVDLHVAFANVAPAQLKGGGMAEETRSSLELADPNAYVLDPYEFASVLSYTYTGSIPDAELLAAAASGALNSPAGVTEQVSRLLDSPKAEKQIKHFIADWMRVNRMYMSNFERDNPRFTSDVKDSMVQELQSFFWYIFDDEDVPFKEFYSADYTFLNATLADFYGIPKAAGNGFVKTPTTQRGGATTLGAFLTTWSHPDGTAPILRGVNVREQMLCHHIDPPPTTKISDIEARRAQEEKVAQLLEDGAMTSRLYYESITDNVECAGCHAHDINPLGGGLEDFDQVGLPRTEQLDFGKKGVFLDVSIDGVLHGAELFKDYSSEEPFTGAKQLSKVLGETQAVQSCLAEKAFRLALGRPIRNAARDQLKNERTLTPQEVDDYSCAIETLGNALSESNQSPKAMFKALGNLDLMRFRR